MHVLSHGPPVALLCNVGVPHSATQSRAMVGLEVGGMPTWSQQCLLPHRVIHKRGTMGKPDQKDLNENMAATQGLSHMITDCKKLFQVGGCSVSSPVLPSQGAAFPGCCQQEMRPCWRGARPAESVWGERRAPHPSAGQLPLVSQPQERIPAASHVTSCRTYVQGGCVHFPPSLVR